MLLAALLLHSAYLVDSALHDPLATALISDSAMYHDWARRIAGGDLLGPAEPFHHPPLYPYVLALIQLVAGAAPLALAAVQVLAVEATLFLAYALARALVSRRAALALVGAAALYLPLPHYATKLLPATFAALTAAATLWQFRRADDPARARGALFLGGLLFGTLCALRPNQLVAAALVLPAVAFAGLPAAGRLRAGARRLGLLALGAALPILPFTLKNALHGGEPVLIADSGGINLWFAHQDASGVSFRTGDPRFGGAANQAAVARAVAAQALGEETPSWSAVSAYFARRALDYALGHPLVEAERLLRRAVAFVSNYEYCIIYPPAAERAAGATGRLFLVPGGLFLALAFGGMVAGRRRSPALLAAAAAFVLGQLATALVFFQYSRFRLVAIPACLVLGAALLALARDRAEAPRRRRAAGIVAAAVLALSFWPAGTEADEQTANGHLALADAWLGRGDAAAAADHLERAAALAPRMARVSLARVRLARARDGDAAGLAAVEAELSRAPGEPILLALAATILVDAKVPGDPARAADYARRAIAAAPGLIAGHAALGKALILQQDFAGAAAALARAAELPGADADLYALLGGALRRSGRVDEARAALERALALAPDHATARRELAALRP